MNFIQKRNRRLRMFAKKYVEGKEGGEPFGNFLSLEATFDNVQTDLELVKYGFTDEVESGEYTEYIRQEPVSDAPDWGVI